MPGFDRKATLAAIKQIASQSGQPPTVRELADVLSISTTATYRRLISLRDTGDVSWLPGRARTLKIVRKKA
jgi:SOS-response transcriptional repressor LexA